uniref:Uncharacterized protein n=1 Tax=Peronospora matthiolae TaxID=2874970 RepID=A0AAV1VFV3_9STRA
MIVVRNFRPCSNKTMYETTEALEGRSAKTRVDEHDNMKKHLFVAGGTKWTPVIVCQLGLLFMPSMV